MQKELVVKQVIEKYADMVYRIALTRCGIVENAEDVFQDVFIKYSQKMPKFESEEHRKAWLIRVNINLTKNINNSAWNKRIVTLDENIEFETKEQEDIFFIVCSLPKDYKTVIYLSYYEGYKVKEIAEILKKSEGTIKTWLFRARLMLKEKIEGGFENE